MKTFLSLALLLLMTGCASPLKDASALVKELAKDQATAYVRVPTPYGTILFIRANPSTNSSSYSIDPEGKVVIGKP